ncbi:hypothetical protein [Nonomuraea cypriaca]|uniref:hypothetical protein n=1 Tax=Nonomuraea cypriaca TaxID=1187855 RepID=UPI001A9C2982|nr:hypothetical protein [Nonomuraea cypriaca]
MARDDTGEQVWDPFGTLRRALWIGGGQWAGKSTVARLLATRYGLTAYHYDYHDARGHDDRRIARRVRLGESPAPPDPDVTWVRTTPEDMAAETLAGFPARFEWAGKTCAPWWRDGPSSPKAGGYAHRNDAGMTPRGISSGQRAVRVI